MNMNILDEIIFDNERVGLSRISVRLLIAPESSGYRLRFEILNRARFLHVRHNCTFRIPDLRQLEVSADEMCRNMAAGSGKLPKRIQRLDWLRNCVLRIREWQVLSELESDGITHLTFYKVTTRSGAYAMLGFDNSFHRLVPLSFIQKWKDIAQRTSAFRLSATPFGTKEIEHEDRKERR